MRRTSIARDVYGKPRHDNDGDLDGGKKARATNLRVTTISATTFCHDCDRPTKLCLCEHYAAKRPKDRDSVMTQGLYAHKATRNLFYRSKGRIA
jgi:hypothetical protein